MSRVTLQGIGRGLRAFLMIRPRVHGGAGLAYRCWLDQEPVRLVGVTHHSSAARFPCAQTGVYRTLRVESEDQRDACRRAGLVRSPLFRVRNRVAGARACAAGWLWQLEACPSFAVQKTGTSVLEANLSLISVRQNQVVQAISAWAAIIAVPTFFASIWGMNFVHMPELDLVFGYPMALGVMLCATLLLYRFFRRIKWL